MSYNLSGVALDRRGREKTNCVAEKLSTKKKKFANGEQALKPEARPQDV